MGIWKKSFGIDGELPPQDTPLGLISGGGEFPVVLARAAQEMGYRLFIVVIGRKDLETFEPLGAECRAYGLDQGESVLSFLCERKIRFLLMAGGMPKTLIYQSGFKPDPLTRTLLQRAASRGDDALLKAVARTFELKGIEVLTPGLFLKEAITPKGVLSRRPPTEDEKKDIEFGRKIAKAIGFLDIGQTVVVKDRTVVAVEAMEGTDGLIRGVRNLKIHGGVIVKVSKPQQDLRFDMPLCGLQTIQAARDSACSVLALEAGRSLLFQREDALRLADEVGLSIVGI